mmetsp:Transcript_20495/g.51303  ORF Transcript_20495/g.51303 Transcript_20495/m.51303 type:complete len:203 (-) Transcript_20495:141-749(-)
MTRRKAPSWSKTWMRPDTMSDTKRWPLSLKAAPTGNLNSPLPNPSLPMVLTNLVVPVQNTCTLWLIRSHAATHCVAPVPCTATPRMAAPNCSGPVPIDPYDLSTPNIASPSVSSIKLFSIRRVASSSLISPDGLTTFSRSLDLMRSKSTTSSIPAHSSPRTPRDTPLASHHMRANMKPLSSRTDCRPPLPSICDRSNVRAAL